MPAVESASQRPDPITDGYPDGQPAAGIQKGDSLVFAIKILIASN